MEIMTRALLLLVASILVAKIECAPSQRARIDETVQSLSGNELRRLFQEDARLTASSESNSQSSEELRGRYQPMPYSPVLQNGLNNIAGGPPGGNNANNNVLVPQPY